MFSPCNYSSLLVVADYVLFVCVTSAMYGHHDTYVMGHIFFLVIIKCKLHIPHVVYPFGFFNRQGLFLKYGITCSLSYDI